MIFLATTTTTRTPAWTRMTTTTTTRTPVWTRKTTTTTRTPIWTTKHLRDDWTEIMTEYWTEVWTEVWTTPTPIWIKTTTTTRSPVWKETSTTTPTWTRMTTTPKKNDKCADECYFIYGGKVCGKDGKTYRNACIIKCIGVVS